MTESDWLDATNPQAMLLFLQNSGKASDRKLRLFAAAVCRRVWPLLNDERSRAAVEVAERLSDGEANDEERVVALTGAYNAWSMPAEAIAKDCLNENALEGARDAARHGGWTSLHRTTGEREAQAAFLRDIFGRLPFLPSYSIDPTWLTWINGTIKQLADAAYEHRSMPSGHLEPDRLAVLADALEEVGADGTLVEHLRSPGPHVRGCHAVDLLVGKE